MPTAQEDLVRRINLSRTFRKAPAIMAVVVRHHGAYVLSAARGVRKYDLDETAPGNSLADDDVYPMGSVAKPISGYMLAVLFRNNVYDWETTIGDVFPELNNASCRKHFKVRDDYLRATVREMMTHTARFQYTPTFGTSETLKNIITSFNGQQQDEYCRREAEMRRRYNYVIASQRDAPGPVGVYNGGPILPVAMMERVTGKPYQALMKEYVFDPLDMRQAGIGRTSTDAATPDGVWLHYFDFQAVNPVPSGYHSSRLRSYDAHAPANGVYLSGSDAAKFIAAQCVDSTATRPLKDASLEETLAISANGFSVSGWGSGRSGVHPVISHDGSDGNQYTRMTIWPRRGEGYMVCTNVGGVGELDGKEVDLGQTVVNDVATEIDDMLRNWTTRFPGE